MKEPFDIIINSVVYSIFPEEDEIYTVFKEGIEYAKIQKDTEEHWLKLDPNTELPLFDNDAEINRIGQEIQAFNE